MWLELCFARHISLVQSTDRYNKIVLWCTMQTVKQMNVMVCASNEIPVDQQKQQFQDISFFNEMGY